MVKSNVRHVFNSFAKYSTSKRIFFSLQIAYIILVCFGDRKPLMRKVGIPGTAGDRETDTARGYWLPAPK